MFAFYKLFLIITGLPAVSMQLFRSLRTMKIQMRYGWSVDRYERPKSFWVMILIFALSDIALVCLISTFFN
jgi:hypothetical protein